MSGWMGASSHSTDLPHNGFTRSVQTFLVRGFDSSRGARTIASMPKWWRRHPLKMDLVGSTPTLVANRTAGETVRCFPKANSSRLLEEFPPVGWFPETRAQLDETVRFRPWNCRFESYQVGHIKELSC